MWPVELRLGNAESERKWCRLHASWGALYYTIHCLPYGGRKSAFQVQDRHPLRPLMSLPSIKAACDQEAWEQHATAGL